MGVSSTEASLQAVRQDLDLSAAGSILERPVLNRVNKRSGPISLSEHKGVAMGAQLTIVGGWNDPPNYRYNGYKGFYPQISGNPSISGDTITLEAGLSGPGGGDGTCQYQCPFKVHESGWHNLSCNLEFIGDAYYRLTRWQVAVVCSATGYLSGITRNELVQSGDVNMNGPMSWSVNLTTSRPYGVVVLYIIRNGGGDASKPKSYAKFTNTKLVRT